MMQQQEQQQCSPDSNLGKIKMRGSGMLLFTHTDVSGAPTLKRVASSIARRRSTLNAYAPKGGDRRGSGTSSFNNSSMGSFGMAKEVGGNVREREVSSVGDASTRLALKQAKRDRRQKAKDGDVEEAFAGGSDAWGSVDDEGMTEIVVPVAGGDGHRRPSNNEEYSSPYLNLMKREEPSTHQDGTTTKDDKPRSKRDNLRRGKRDLLSGWCQELDNQKRDTQVMSWMADFGSMSSVSKMIPTSSSFYSVGPLLVQLRTSETNNFENRHQNHNSSASTVNNNLSSIVSDMYTVLIADGSHADQKDGSPLMWGAADGDWVPSETIGVVTKQEGVVDVKDGVSGCCDGIYLTELLHVPICVKANIVGGSTSLSGCFHTGGGKRGGGGGGELTSLDAFGSMGELSLPTDCCPVDENTAHVVANGIAASEDDSSVVGVGYFPNPHGDQLIVSRRTLADGDEGVPLMLPTTTGLAVVDHSRVENNTMYSLRPLRIRDLIHNRRLGDCPEFDEG